jgi:hypothetical protein
MPKLIFLFAVLVGGAGLLACLPINRTVRSSVDQTQSGSSRPELDYLKAVNSAAPPKDPQLLFLLMGHTPMPTSRRKAQNSSPRV